MVFFLAPDTKTVSPAFLESAFARGFEAHALPDSPDLRGRAEALAEAFPQAMVYLTLGPGADLDDWRRTIVGLRTALGARLRFGVLWEGSGSEARDTLWSASLLWETGLEGGCVRLEGGLRRRQNLLLRVLEAQQTGGRRRFLRMRCPPGSLALLPGFQGQAVLVDLSVNHAVLRFSGPGPAWDAGTHVRDLRMVLPGKHVVVDATVEGRRNDLWVLRFPPRGTGDGAVADRVNRLIYAYQRQVVAGALEVALRKRAFFRA